MPLRSSKRNAAPVASPDLPPLSANRLLAHRRLASGDAIDRVVVTVNLAESPLAWLVRRGMVTPDQFAASERLRGDFIRAGQSSRVTMRWDPAPIGSGGGGGIDPTTSQITARQRFDAAIAAAGPGLNDVLWRVVCVGEGLETAERALGWPSRAGKLVLLLALDRLAGHYRVG